VRIAVTTGEALIRLDARPEAGEGMASGDVVNTAARLQSAAPINGILADKTTYRATRHVIDYREVLEKALVERAADSSAAVLGRHADEVDVRLLRIGLGEKPAHEAGKVAVVVLGHEARSLEVEEEEPAAASAPSRDRPTTR